MAYGCPTTFCPRIPFFSAKGYSYDGVSIGNLDHDNARMISENAPFVAAWKETVTPISDATVSTNYNWYYNGEAIEVYFDYKDPDNRDWVAIYADATDPVNNEPLLWLYTCGSQECHGSKNDGTLTFGYGDPKESEAGLFPLPAGEYVAVLARNAVQPYDILASSPLFDVGVEPWVEIGTDKEYYDYGEDIKVSFEYGNAEKRDWVGIYYQDADIVHGEPLLWFFTCGTQQCKNTVGYDTLTFGYAEPNESEVSTFPLSDGTYVAVLARGAKQPYEILGYVSDEFVVDD